MRFCYFVYNKNGKMKEFLLLLLTISKCLKARPTDYPSGLFVRPSIRLSACLHLSVKINWSNRRYACLDNVFWKKAELFFFDAFQTRENVYCEEIIMIFKLPPLDLLKNVNFKGHISLSLIAATHVIFYGFNIFNITFWFDFIVKITKKYEGHV